ncbi:autophagy-related protein 9 isoform X2 [Phalaenopsis equestris]|uniref:autophagy-related protein 9 isoform X2 n=1 Tax=Phalaenopsis equestris TaxID=78828 RepID=UPI0009E33346|nr:autophagy-related protein 9 isoform X2 [Phalaenopsis equestris]
MMFSAQKSFLDPIRLKWQSKNESSVNVHLLSDEPPEIELSDYGIMPCSDIENPSELLNGEGLKEEPIADLDLFFESLYNYYCEKGLLCIVIKWIVELLTVVFVLGFIWFFLLVVDWRALRNTKCGIEAVESGQKPCDLAKEVINQHPLVPFTFTKGIIVGCMIILTIYGLFNFLKFFVQFKNTLKIRHFYYYSLNVTDREMRTSPWPTILEKVVRVQKERQLCVVKELSAHDIVMRIMRKENYLIGMLNKGVLALPISWWVPGAGPSVISKATGNKYHLILPKTLEWTLNWCIFQSMFDSKFCIRRDFITNPSLLRKRLMVVGIVMFVISPCLVIFMLVYLFLWHAEQFYNHPRTASSRRWSNLSKWIFREFNEIFRRNLFWYAAIFGTVTAIARAVVTDELHVLDPEGAMAFVFQQTHYMPKRWRRKENSDTVRAEVETLFQYTAIMLLEEMASILITPFLLVFVVPERVDDILQFISDFTVDVEGVGHVCSLSLFDFVRHGNRKYASPFNAAKDMRSSQGKMEKSFLSFQSAYPSWEPNPNGQELLRKLRNFREQQLREEIKREFSPIWTSPTNQYVQFQPELIHRFPFSKPYNNGGFPVSSHNLIPDLRTLDNYYLAQPVHPVDADTASETIREPWRTYNQPPYREDVEEHNRMRSHWDASTSSRFFHGNSFHRHVTEPHRGTDNWWDRPAVQSSSGNQASFLEPPVFYNRSFGQYNDDLSEQSVEEEVEDGVGVGVGGGRSNLRPPLWETTYMDEDDDEGFGLHFTDELKNGRSQSSIGNGHERYLGNLPVRIIPRSNDPVE